MEEYSMNALSYNTERAKLHIPEYGRNVQNMINYAKQLETKEERNLAARAIIDVMGQLNPQLRDIEDYNHKLWTHLFIMSNFEIDVDSPYEVPKPENLNKKPKIMAYPNKSGKYGHFGYYLEQIIKETGKLEDEEEKEFLAARLGNLLKQDYLTFHTENVENSTIAAHLNELSNGKLELKDTSVLKSTNAILKQSGVKVVKPSRKRTKRRKR